MLSNKPSMFMSDLVFFTAKSSSFLRCHIGCLEFEETFEPCVGLLLLSWWLIAAGTGQGAFAAAQWFFGSFLGWIALFGLIVAAWYHTCAGIRHLFWDAGRGFAMEDAYRSGRMVVIGTAVLSVITFLLILI